MHLLIPETTQIVISGLGVHCTVDQRAFQTQML
jgi:hypothetical protein